MRRKVGIGFVVVGAVLLIGALVLYAYNKWDDWRAGQSVVLVTAALESEEARVTKPDYDGTLADEDSSGSAVPEDGVMPALEVDGYEYIGTLSIPRFGLELPIMNEWSYPGLKIAPGRYVGSVWTDDLVICGHNYERHFGNLKYLETGDRVTFTDIMGNVFEYEVELVEILQPTAVDEMIESGWDLTLFTCTIGGRTRVTVRCMRLD